MSVYAYLHTHIYKHTYALYCFVSVAILRILSSNTVITLLSFVTVYGPQVRAVTARTKTATTSLFELHLIEQA